MLGYSMATYRHRVPHPSIHSPRTVTVYANKLRYPVYTVFLPYYLEAHGATLGDGSTYQTYRDWSISSVVGIWGPILSAFLVQVPFLGRRRSMTLTACACAAFSGAFTTVKNESQNLAFSSMINFWLNALYGIIYGSV